MTTTYNRSGWFFCVSMDLGDDLVTGGKQTGTLVDRRIARGILAGNPSVANGACSRQQHEQAAPQSGGGHA